jgi:serine/threonine-protein kinase
VKAPAALVVGDVVAERFEVLGVLGAGTTGTVFHAHEFAEDRDVALKVIHPHLCSDRQIMGRFRREADILRRLEGPHLCRLIDCIEDDDGLLVIVLEYAAGGSLDAYLEQRGPLSSTEATIVVTQICAALEPAHAAGIIHRDLKPSNVLIDQPANDDGLSFETGRSLQVVDFGLAKIIHGDSEGSALTEHDMIFGTPAYMSPEQVRGEELDPRCDIYAMGVMLFEMLVGEVPFDSPGALGTMTKHLTEAVPLPSAVAPHRNIPAVLNRVVLCALAKERDARFDSAEHMAEALAAFAAPPTIAEPARGAGTASDSEIDAVAEERPSDAAADVANTLQSEEHAGALAKPRGRPPVAVTKARFSSMPSRRSAGPTSPVMLRESGREMRMWLFLTAVAVAAAVASGVWLGIR